WYLRLVAGGGGYEHNPALLVERSVPGGLVTRHRHWYAEERLVHRRLFARIPIPIARRHQRRIRAARALLFARVGFANGDLAFALARLAEAVLSSPLDSVRIAALRLRRWLRHDATQAWADPASRTAP